MVILFVWIIRVFLGPARSADRVFTRWFPTHFVTPRMVDLPSRHGGLFGDLGIAPVWVTRAALVACGDFATCPTDTPGGGTVGRRAAPGLGRPAPQPGARRATGGGSSDIRDARQGHYTRPPDRGDLTENR